MLVENNEVTVKREHKQAKSTPYTQEIYKQLQMVIVDGHEPLDTFFTFMY
ncbi:MULTISPECIES: hypothetical protein [Bacillus]|nr:hypothetical protein [Bacillus sp. 491mf]